MHRIGPRVRQAHICQCTARVGLPQNNVGAVFGAGWRFAPDQHAVVPRVGYRQSAAKGRDAGRDIHGVRSHEALCVAAFAAKVGLAQKYIGRGVIPGRNRLPPQHPVMPSIGYPERAVRMQADATRPEHQVGRRGDRLNQRTTIAA